MLNILNFPYYIWSKAESLLLVGIIPGRKEPKKTDLYLEVIVDNIHYISGQTIYDSLKDEYFVIKANIILYVLDYPGHNKIFHCNGKYLDFKCALV